MDRKTYLLDPCGASSLPFWKTNSVSIPDDLLILREDDPHLPAMREKYTDTPYFKLIHHMTHIDRSTLPDGFRFICPDEQTLSDHIFSCYTSEGVSPEELREYRLHPTFCDDLWLAVVQEKTGEIVASGIAELDTVVREGILEWIQVSPAYRRQGFGRFIVCELLARMQGRADFVTVSGKADDPADPHGLYARCGFEDGVVWHVLRIR